jgi:hypothetical protein
MATPNRGRTSRRTVQPARTADIVDPPARIAPGTTTSAAASSRQLADKKAAADLLKEARRKKVHDRLPEAVPDWAVTYWLLEWEGAVDPNGLGLRIYGDEVVALGDFVQTTGGFVGEAIFLTPPSDESVPRRALVCCMPPVEKKKPPQETGES